LIVCADRPEREKEKENKSQSAEQQRIIIKKQYEPS